MSLKLKLVLALALSVFVSQSGDFAGAVAAEGVT